MSEWKNYQRKNAIELRPYVDGEDLSQINVDVMTYGRAPKKGDMIARNPLNHADQWLVTAEYFADNYEPNPIDLEAL